MMRRYKRGQYDGGSEAHHDVGHRYSTATVPGTGTLAGSCGELAWDELGAELPHKMGGLHHERSTKHTLHTHTAFGDAWGAWGTLTCL